MTTFMHAANELATQRVRARDWQTENLKALPKLHPIWRDLKEAEDAFDRMARHPKPVSFSKKLIGGHELRVEIPGLGTVHDQDTMALWEQMADLLDDVATHFRARAEDMRKKGPQA